MKSFYAKKRGETSRDKRVYRNLRRRCPGGGGRFFVFFPSELVGIRIHVDPTASAVLTFSDISNATGTPPDVIWHTFICVLICSKWRPTGAFSLNVRSCRRRLGMRWGPNGQRAAVCALGWRARSLERGSSLQAQPGSEIGRAKRLSLSVSWYAKQSSNPES